MKDLYSQFGPDDQDEAARWREELRIAKLDALEEFGNGLEFSSNVAVKYITGIWDLLMGGSTRANVENKYQSLSGGPAVDPLFLRHGFVVTHPNGTRAIGQSCFSDDRSSVSLGADCRQSPSRYHPGQIYLRRCAGRPNLRRLQDLRGDVIWEPEPATERPIGQRERDTLVIVGRIGRDSGRKNRLTLRGREKRPLPGGHRDRDRPHPEGRTYFRTGRRKRAGPPKARTIPGRRPGKEGK